MYEHLNKKKVAIVVFIICIIILMILGYILHFSKKEPTLSYTTLTSTDGKFSIQMPSSIKYQVNAKTDNNYTIDLYSEEDEMFIYATSIAKLREVDLYEIAEGDKTSYLKDKENIREDSRY